MNKNNEYQLYVIHKFRDNLDWLKQIVMDIQMSSYKIADN